MRATKAKLDAGIDKEQMVNLETEGKRLETCVGEIESSKPFGFATFRAKAAIEDIRWHKL